MEDRSDNVMHFYTVLKNSDDERELIGMINALRADNGRLLRGLLKKLSKDGGDDSVRLAEVLKHHPSLRDLVPNSE
jgi:hypothetical protein